MNNDLYQTIEELKNTLVNIDSARKQVSDTVAAYSATQSGIQNYVDKLHDIENALKQLLALLQNNKVIIEQQVSSAIVNLQTTCTEITTRIQKGQEAMSLSFSEKLSSRIQEIDKQVSVFDNSIKRAESLAKNIKDTSDNVANVVQTIKVMRQELSSSQKEQDVVLSRIEGNVSSLMASCSESVKALNDEINSKATNLRNDLGQLKDSNENIIQKLANNQHTVLRSLDNLKNEISESKAKIEKQAKINRNIGFATLALLVLLVILHFIA